MYLHELLPLEVGVYDLVVLLVLVLGGEKQEEERQEGREIKGEREG